MNTLKDALIKELNRFDRLYKKSEYKDYSFNLEANPYRPDEGFIVYSIGDANKISVGSYEENTNHLIFSLNRDEKEYQCFKNTNKIFNYLQLFSFLKYEKLLNILNNYQENNNMVNNLSFFSILNCHFYMYSESDIRCRFHTNVLDYRDNLQYYSNYIIKSEMSDLEMFGINKGINDSFRVCFYSDLVDKEIDEMSDFEKTLISMHYI